MIHVIAIITALPGQRAAMLEAFHANVPAVRAEPGCIAYQPVIDTPDAGAFQAPIGPDAFMVIEAWESREALIAHAGAPHMIAYGKTTKAMTASRVIHVLSPA